jgi:hypothetical protein
MCVEPLSHLSHLLKLASHPSFLIEPTLTSRLGLLVESPDSRLILLMETTLTSQLTHGHGAHTRISSYSWNSHLSLIMELTLTSQHTQGIHTHISSYSWSRHSHLILLMESTSCHTHGIHIHISPISWSRHSHLIILMEPTLTS